MAPAERMSASLSSAIPRRNDGYHPHEPECRMCLDRGFRITPSGRAAPCECEAPSTPEAGPWAVPQRLSLEMTFASFQPTGQPSRTALETMMRWAKHPIGWIVLAGECGTGKTHLAVAAVSEAMAAGATGAFGRATDMVESLRREALAEPSEPIERSSDQLREADLLVIDDLGAERKTEFAQEQINAVLAHRYDEGLPTIITTNLDPEDMKTRNPRLASRLSDIAMVTRIRMEGEDYRAA